MRAVLHARVLLAHAQQEWRARLDATQLQRFQQRAVARLREWAVARSPFYRQRHRGLERAPLGALPVIDKGMLMAEFDQVVTDPHLRLADLLRHLSTEPSARYRGRYVVLGTSGSTGRRGVFVFDPREWIGTLAAITRPPAWAGAPAPWTRPRAAVIASTEPTHFSGRIARDLRTWLMPTWHGDAAWPIADLVAGLNRWRPDVLAVYPSILSALSREQDEGRLQIAPRHIGTSAEVLTPVVRAQAWRAFGVDVFDTYGATELAPIAAQCRAGSLHLFEDRALIEVADDRGRPVPPGTLGAQLLLTVFDRYTQPLIRYALSDEVLELPGSCPCGRVSRRLRYIEGRVEESLVLPSRADTGAVRIHPNAVHHSLEAIPCNGWQVRQLDPAPTHGPITGAPAPRLDVVLVGSSPDLAVSEALRRQLEQLIVARGARVADIDVRWQAELPRGGTGKAPLIVRVRASAPASIGAT